MEIPLALTTDRPYLTSRLLLAGLSVRNVILDGMTLNASNFQVGDWVRMANGRECAIAVLCIGGKEVYVKTANVGRGAGIVKVPIASLTKIDLPTAGQ